MKATLQACDDKHVSTYTDGRPGDKDITESMGVALRQRLGLKACLLVLIYHALAVQMCDQKLTIIVVSPCLMDVGPG